MKYRLLFLLLASAALLPGWSLPAHAGKEQINQAANDGEEALLSDSEAQRRAAPGRPARDARKPTPAHFVVAASHAIDRDANGAPCRVLGTMVQLHWYSRCEPVHDVYREAVQPDQVWVAVDASRKPDDTARWVHAVAARIPVDAVAVEGTEHTATPDTVEELNLPIGWVDGAAATRSTRPIWDS